MGDKAAQEISKGEEQTFIHSCWGCGHNIQDVEMCSTHTHSLGSEQVIFLTMWYASWHYHGWNISDTWALCHWVLALQA